MSFAPEDYVIALPDRGDRVVFNRKKGTARFLLTNRWPECSIGETKPPAKSLRILRDRDLTESDKIFLRYCYALDKSERPPEYEAPWILRCLKAADEIDLLTQKLRDTIAGQKNEEKDLQADSLPGVEVEWCFTDVKFRDSLNVGFNTHAGTCYAYRWGSNDTRLIQFLADERTVRTYWCDKDKQWAPLSHFSDISVFEKGGWKRLEESGSRPLDLLKSSLDGKEFGQVNHNWRLVWEALFKERCSTFANLLCLARRESPQKEIHASCDKPSQTVCQETKTPVLKESHLMELYNEVYEANVGLEREKNALRKQLEDCQAEKAALENELAMLRSSLPSTTARGEPANSERGEPSSTPPQVSGIPDAAATVNKYRQFKDQMLVAYSLCESDKKQQFAQLLHAVVLEMREHAQTMYSKHFGDMLASMGGLEMVENASQFTRNGFQDYCRKHWKALFMQGIDDYTNSQFHRGAGVRRPTIHENGRRPLSPRAVLNGTEKYGASGSSLNSPGNPTGLICNQDSGSPVGSMIETAAERLSSLPQKGLPGYCNVRATIKAACRTLWEVTVHFLLQPTPLMFCSQLVLDKYAPEAHLAEKGKPGVGSEVLVVLPMIGSVQPGQKWQVFEKAYVDVLDESGRSGAGSPSSLSSGASASTSLQFGVRHQH